MPTSPKSMKHHLFTPLSLCHAHTAAPSYRTQASHLHAGRAGADGRAGGGRGRGLRDRSRGQARHSHGPRSWWGLDHPASRSAGISPCLCLCLCLYHGFIFSLSPSPPSYFFFPISFAFCLRLRLWHCPGSMSINALFSSPSDLAAAGPTRQSSAARQVCAAGFSEAACVDAGRGPAGPSAACADGSAGQGSCLQLDA